MSIQNKKTLACAVLGVACLAMAPITASAQEIHRPLDGLIDVYQDGTLFITYEEYLERQRRVIAARNAAIGSSPAPLLLPTVTAQASRSTDSMALRSQWTIGAFR